MAGEARDIDRRLANLEKRMDERDREREVFRRNWSDRDVTDLRRMLNGYLASAAIKAFWSSLTGKAVILGAATMQLATFGIAVYNFLTTAHHP